MIVVIIGEGEKLKHLKGVPKKVGNSFDCSYTGIESLIDGPQWVGKVYFCSNTVITSLEGAPEYVGGSFYCRDTKVTSLQGIGKNFLKQIENDIDFHNTPLKSHVLGILLIKDLKRFLINNRNLAYIIGKHLEGDRDILDCQEELINKGLKDYAKL